MGLSAIGYLTISVSISLHRSSCSAIHLLFFIFLWFHFKDSTRFLLSLAPPRGQVMSWVSGSRLPAVLGIPQVLGWRGGDGMDPAGGKALQETGLEKAWERPEYQERGPGITQSRPEKLRFPQSTGLRSRVDAGAQPSPAAGARPRPSALGLPGYGNWKPKAEPARGPLLGCPLPACLLRAMVSHFPMGSRCREARRRRSRS